MHLFAYGSNMCVRKLALAAEGATFVGIARLPRHVLRFHKMSDDGSGKADALLTNDPAHTVWGVVFEVPEASWPQLVSSEGGYREVEVAVFTAADASVRCRTFVAKAHRIGTGLKPYHWYKRYVMQGARGHGLPPEYVSELEAVESVDDPDTARVAKHAPVAC